ncbi:MAG TPA: SDR family oxidoreductase [Firmicutes bacterium]|nr:SDR family oxidoreductase [Bacillota bacterium]
MELNSKLTFRLDGMVAFVSGGGNGPKGGMGAAICRCLGRAGASVAVNDLTEEAALATVRQLEEMGVKALAVPGDVGDSARVNAMIEQVVDHFGRIDILVNNAFNPGPRKYLVDLTDEDWEASMATNLNGPFFLSRAVIPHMRQQGYGRIINISSLAAIRVSMNGAAQYTAMKEALLGLTRHLTVEAARYGITSNAILPAFVLNPRVVERLDEEGIRRMGASAPTKRGADPEEVGMLAVFLASPAAGQITGTAIPIDGGLHCLAGGPERRNAMWAAYKK